MMNAAPNQEALGTVVMTGVIVFCILSVGLAWFDLLPEPTTTRADASPTTVSSTGSTPVQTMDGAIVQLSGTQERASSSASTTALSSSTLAAETRSHEGAHARASTEGVDGEPTRVVIDAIGVDVAVLNPVSTDIDVLDEALLSGVVRYPGSALPGAEGNVFLFGHSSGLPVVHNQNFKAFNGLKDLTQGDLIEVESDGYTHVYRVATVRLTRAEEALVSFDTQGGARLTLSSCNTFGEKEERWVVEARHTGSFERRGAN